MSNYITHCDSYKAFIINSSSLPTPHVTTFPFNNKNILGLRSSSTSDFKLYLNGEKIESFYKMVDLDLPSGTKWANMNVWAETETGYGNYFAWGDTEGVDLNDISDKFNSSWYSSKDCSLLRGNIIPNSEYDMASKNMGGNWRLPTKEECEELIHDTNQEAATINGIKGIKFISKVNSSKYIFIPFVHTVMDGKVSTLSPSYVHLLCSTYLDSINAWTLSLGNAGASVYYLDKRYYGNTVRGVYSKTYEYTAVDLGLPSGTLWADKNVGADTITDFGLYFAWGETIGRTAEGVLKLGECVRGFTRYSSIDTTYEGISWKGYKQSSTELLVGEHYGQKIVVTTDFSYISSYYVINGDSMSYYKPTNKYTKSWYNNLSCSSYDKSAASLNSNITRSSGYDAARENMGGDWQMPTSEDFSELIANTTQEFVTINGVKGCKFIAKNGSGNYIFIPKSGAFSANDDITTSRYFCGSGSEIWASNISTTDSTQAFRFGDEENWLHVASDYRNNGKSIRGVIKD